jgi:hypothetical protein
MEDYVSKDTFRKCMSVSRPALADEQRHTEADARVHERNYVRIAVRDADIFTANVGCLSRSFQAERDSHEECRVDKDTGSFVLGQQWRRTNEKF